MSVEPIFPVEVGRCDDYVTLDTRYRRRLTHYLRRCYRHDADLDIEEVVQETLCRAFERFGQLDPARDPWPWLTVVARNILRDAQRQQAKVLLQQNAAPSAVGIRDELLDEVVAREEAAALSEAISQLPTTQRMVFTLRLIDEWTFADIAAFTGSTENCVRQQLHRARAFIATRWSCRDGRALGLLLPGWAPVSRWWRRLGASRPLQPMATLLIAGTMVLGGLAVVTGTAQGPTQSQGVAKAERQPVPNSQSALETSPNLRSPLATRDPKATDESPPPSEHLVSADITDPPLGRGSHHSVVVKIPTPVGTVEVKYENQNADRAGPVCSLGVVECG